MKRDFARQLIEARMRLGLTQGEFAARIGVSQGAVSRWEKGRHRPSPSVLIRLRRLGHAASPRWHEAVPFERAAQDRPSSGRTRLRLRPIEAPRRRLSDHLRAAVDCAEAAGRHDFASRLLEPLLAQCLDADRRDPRRRRSDDRASAAASSG